VAPGRQVALHLQQEADVPFPLLKLPTAVAEKSKSPDWAEKPREMFARNSPSEARRVTKGPSRCSQKRPKGPHSPPLQGAGAEKYQLTDCHSVESVELPTVLN
jgi:hypothetical protein